MVLAVLMYVIVVVVVAVVAIDVYLCLQFWCLLSLWL